MGLGVLLKDTWLIQLSHGGFVPRSPTSSGRCAGFLPFKPSALQDPGVNNGINGERGARNG
jgi:hypothetical protein